MYVRVLLNAHVHSMSSLNVKVYIYMREVVPCYTRI